MDRAQPQSDETQDARELFLLRLAYREGRMVEAGGNAPVLLNTPDTAWVVFSGKVDIFGVQLRHGEPVGTRSHLCRVEAGNAFFGAIPSDGAGSTMLLAVPVGMARLVRLRRSRFLTLAGDAETSPHIAQLIVNWVQTLTRGAIREMPPQEYVTLQAGETRVFDAGSRIRPARDLVWVMQPEAGVPAHYLGNEQLPALAGSSYLPLAGSAWLCMPAAARLEGTDTPSMLRVDPECRALDQFHSVLLGYLGQQAQHVTEAERRRIWERHDAVRSALESSTTRITSILAPQSRLPGEGNHADTLLETCGLVAQCLGFSVQRPAPASEPRDEVAAVAAASRFRVRPVLLSDNWWQSDCGPLLAFWNADRRPVALLPNGRGCYVAVEPGGGPTTLVTPDVAAQLAPQACTFYRSLPFRSLNAWDLVRFSFKGGTGDLLMLVGMSALIALLGLLAPLLMAQLIGIWIPRHDTSALIQVSLGLIVAALAAASFQVTSSIAVLRLETRADACLQAAVWDRLLRIPTSFFRQYSAGELASAITGLNLVRQLLTTGGVTLVLSGLVGLGCLGLLYVLSPRLATYACLIVALALGFTIRITLGRLRYDREVQQKHRRLVGTVLQLLSGVSKLRVAGAEIFAFAVWAKQFAQQRELAFQARMLDNRLSTFNAVWPVAGLMLIFAGVALQEAGTLSTGAFLAFNAAVGQLWATVFGTCQAIASLTRAVPLYEAARPVLETLPEVLDGRRAPGHLTGAIEINQVHFRYQADGPSILDNVSLRIEPGEFVAVVGPSGAGKSTLLRLLLGFDTPQSGSVYYDGQDLEALDVEAVRKQIGVVLQNTRLMRGTIQHHILGGSLYTLEDAWEAARMAGLARDIEQMPMGMHTYVSEGGLSLSGGQRQRLLIARALVARPRILFFDEATSALDNETQATVTSSLESLKSTRIVIAHRLSTIRNADRIVVLERGKVVQSGTYEELMSVRGPFQELASRQLV